jgi:uncharacterized protein (TIGR03790 family)
MLCGFLTGVLLLALPARQCGALAPEEILVLVNARSAAGRELADHYMERRGVPRRQRLLLSTPESETIDPPTYRERIEAPVRAWFEEPIHRESAIRCLLLFYGLPLRINAADPELKKEIAARKKLRGDLRAELDALAAEAERRPKLAKRLKEVSASIEQLAAKTPRAAVDSELALVRVGDYERRGWLPNPFYVGHRGRKPALAKDQVLMVSRLDGPTPAIVRRLIDDSLAVESNGLRGNACVDARWPAPGERGELSGYAHYDEALHRWAAHLAANWPGETFFDASADLFGPGACPDTALYCGWYSLGRYVDAFTWRPGAVAYHIASSECTTLRTPGSQVWCQRLLEAGVAATLGPVYEPYVQAFPLPGLFFGLLTEGYLTLAECYQVSLPFLSWQMVLVGDPLYRPFTP